MDVNNKFISHDQQPKILKGAKKYTKHQHGGKLTTRCHLSYDTIIDSLWDECV